MSFLTKDEFLKAATVPQEEVCFPELGGKKVLVRGMTARERTEFENSFRTKKGTPIESRKQEIRERLVVACCRDAHGKPLFTTDDVQALGRVRVDLVERVVNVAQRLCGMTDADVEEMAKNSEPTTAGASE